MADPIEIFQTKITTAADALSLINGVFQWAFGSTPPSVTFPFLNWADTGANRWWQRNADDNAWIFKGALDVAFMPIDGWITGPNPVYVSATSIKIVGIDVRDRIQKGTKFRYKQGGNWKYGACYGISFSTDTTILITGGNDYTVASTAITDFSYSNIENPIGYPHWFNYTPSWAANGGMTFTGVTTSVAKYKITDVFVEIFIAAKGTTGGISASGIFATLPIANSDSNPDWSYSSGCSVVDAVSVDNIGGTAVVTQTQILIKKADANNVNWTIGSNTIVRCALKYPY